MNLQKITFFLFLFKFLTIQSLIIESPFIETLIKYVYKDTLVIFDIDNTLIKPIGNVGSDQWFFALVEKEISAGLELQKVNEKLVPIYNRVQEKVQVQLVEKKSVEIIKNLQEKKTPIIAVTMRSIKLSDVTKKQLNSVGIDLSVTSPIKEKQFINHNFGIAFFFEGLMFCDGKDKGSAVKTFLKNLKYLPKKIVYIDDKLKNLVSIENISLELGIEFIGIRYSYLDEEVKKYKLSPEEIFC